MNEQYVKNIHWYPGHMKKATDELKLKLKQIDLIIEILDARSPLSSRNIDLSKLCENKRRIIILNKKDLADLKDFNENRVKIHDNDSVLICSLKEKDDYKIILNEIKNISKDINQKFINKGLKNRYLNCMVIGIPNVGKSSFINYLSKRNSAPVGNIPGFTKANKWIKVDNLFYLLDTPGILPQKYENNEIGINLALIGCIKQEILPIEDLSFKALDLLKNNYLNEFNNKYGLEISSDFDNLDILKTLALKRGYLLKNAVPDIEKAEILILNDLKNGEICKVFLENA